MYLESQILNESLEALKYLEKKLYLLVFYFESLTEDEDEQVDHIATVKATEIKTKLKNGKSLNKIFE